jgi:hypothetical protein
MSDRMWVIGHIIDSAQQREESNSRDLLLVALSNARPVPYVVDVYVCVYTKQDNRASVSQHIEVIRDRLFPPRPRTDYRYDAIQDAPDARQLRSRRSMNQVSSARSLCTETASSYTTKFLDLGNQQIGPPPLLVGSKT